MNFNPSKGLWILLIASLVTLMAAPFFGALSINLDSLLGEGSVGKNVFMNIRLPRVLFAFGAGALLAYCGCLLQALFRNPLADPGLLGVSSGCAIGAISFFLWGIPLLEYFQLSQDYSVVALPIMAFLGGLVSLLPAIWMINHSSAGASTGTLILLGIAINAFCGSLMGLLMAVFPNDAQLRSITFWTLGSLAGAQWKFLIPVLGLFILCIFFALRFGKSLNLLSLGEAEAYSTGVDIKKMKWWIIGLSALATSLTVCFAGFIGFIGLVVPHAMRLMLGADHRYLLLASLCFGGILLAWADTIARTILNPMELPVGVITALIGTPVLIQFLRKSMTRGIRL